MLRADTAVGSAGSTSASRQTYVTGGAVKAACEAVREQLDRSCRRATDGDRAIALARARSRDRPLEATVEWHHRPTHPLDERGQGDAHLQFAFSAHRAVVDVDTELGLVRVVELATAQEVGRAMNPQALEGQIEGGSAQGLGLALMEEIVVRDGEVLNASFTDYLLPTTLDMPRVRMDMLEHADPSAPYGAEGRGRAAEHLDPAGGGRPRCGPRRAGRSRASRCGRSTSSKEGLSRFRFGPRAARRARRRRRPARGRSA